MTEGANRSEVVVLLDRSGSMSGDGKAQALNAAMAETLPLLRHLADDLDFRLSVLTYATTAEVHLQADLPGAPIEWTPVDVQPRGLSELGLALGMSMDLISRSRAVATALLLVSDGRPTDTSEPSFESAMARLGELGRSRRVLRSALGIGRDADHQTLLSFSGGDRPTVCSNPTQLVGLLRPAILDLARRAGG